MDNIHFFAFCLPGTDENFNDRLRSLGDVINRQKVNTPQWVNALKNQVIRQCTIGPSHAVFLLEDGRLCRVGFNVITDKLEYNLPDSKTWSAKKAKKSNVRMRAGGRVPYRFNASSSGTVTTNSGLSTSTSQSSSVSRLARLNEARNRYSSLFMTSVAGASGSGSTGNVIAPSQVPEEFIAQVQSVLQGKSRTLIIRELQRTNLDVNLAVNNLLSRDDDEGEEDDSPDYMADDLMSFVESNLQDGAPYFIDNDPMLVADYINYESLRSGRRQSVRPPTSNSGGSTDNSVFLERRWLESRLRDPLSMAHSVTTTGQPASAVTTTPVCSSDVGGSSSRVGASQNFSYDAIVWDEPEWLVMLPDKDGNNSLPKFNAIAAMHSELVAVTANGQLFQWRWNSRVPYQESQNPNVHHPKTSVLGLKNEKIILLAASSLRASVVTESGAVATWMDQSVSSYCAYKLQHPATIFSELNNEKIVSIALSELMTCVKTESGNLFWWGVMQFSQRRKLLEKQATKTKKSSGSSLINSLHSSSQRGNPFVNQVSEGCNVTKRKCPMYHAGAIGFRTYSSVPRVGRLMEDIWNLDSKCRFKILPTEPKKIDDSKKQTEMMPPPSPVSVGSDSSSVKSSPAVSRKRKKSVSPHPMIEDEQEEYWSPKNVVFIEDSKSIPIGTVVKVDGNIAAVKFPSDRHPLGRDFSDGDTSTLIKECRLFQKDDLQVLKPNSLPKFPDCIQKLPRRISLPEKLKIVAFDVDAKGINCVAQMASNKLSYILIDPCTSRFEENRRFPTESSSFFGLGRSVNLLCSSEEHIKVVLDGNGCLYPMGRDDAVDLRTPAPLSMLPTSAVALATHYPKDSIQFKNRILVGIFVTTAQRMMSAVLQCDCSAVSRQLAELDHEASKTTSRVHGILMERCDGNRNILHAAVYLCKPLTSYSGSSESNSSSVSGSNAAITTIAQSSLDSIINATPVGDLCSTVESLISAATSHAITSLAARSTIRDATVRSVDSTSSSSSSRDRDQPISGAIPTISWPPDPPAYEALSAISDRSMDSSVPTPCKQEDVLTTPRGMTDFERQRAAMTILSDIVNCTHLASVELLSGKDARGMTPFMLAISLRAYDAALHLLNAAEKLSLIEGRLDMDTFMRMIYPANSSHADYNPLYMLCCNDNCSFTWTGDLHINQDIFECRTCGLQDTLCCCTECARTCHQGHECKIKKISPTAYCDCWRRGRCCALSEGNQVARYQLLCSLLPITNLVTIPNARGEHLLLFLIQTVARQVSEQSGFSVNKSTSSRTAKRDTDVESMPEHNLDPPKFCPRALTRVLQDWNAVKSMICSGFEIPRLDLADDQRAYLMSQTGSARLDAFAFKLVVRCKVEMTFLDTLLSTLVKRMVNTVGDEKQEAMNVSRRFVRAIARIFVILSLETQQSKSKSSMVSEPIRRCKKVFQTLIHFAIEELIETADALIAPVRMGIARPTRAFATSVTIGEKQGSGELFNIEPMPLRSTDGPSNSINDVYTGANNSRFDHDLNSTNNDNTLQNDQRGVMDLDDSGNGEVLNMSTNEPILDTIAEESENEQPELNMLDLGEDRDEMEESAPNHGADSDMEIDLLDDDSDTSSDVQSVEIAPTINESMPIPDHVSPRPSAVNAFLSDEEDVSHSEDGDEDDESDSSQPYDGVVSGSSTRNVSMPQSIQWAIGGQPLPPPRSTLQQTQVIYVDPSSIRRNPMSNSGVQSNTLEACTSGATNVSLAKGFSLIMRYLAELINLVTEEDLSVSNLDAQAAKLLSYVEQRLEVTWAWLATVMDSAEAQLKFGSALIAISDSQHPSHPLHPSQKRHNSQETSVTPSTRPFLEPTRRSSRSASHQERADSSAARRDFLHYALSLMRAHSDEHSDALPIIDVASLKHVAYILDALVYFAKHGRECVEAGCMQSEDNDSSVALESDDDESYYDSADDDQPPLPPQPRHNFFRRTNSTLSLGTPAPDSFNLPLQESLPLAEKPYLLTASATKEQLFSRAKNYSDYVDPGFTSTITLNHDDFEIVPLKMSLSARCIPSSYDPESQMVHDLSLKGEAPRGSTPDEASTSLFFSKRETPTWRICSQLSHDMLLGRWKNCLELFSRIFMEDVGSENGSLLSEVGGFDVREARFKKEMEKLRNSQTRDLILEVERERSCLILQTLRQLHYSKRSCSLPMAVHKVKVSFKNEPGEGEGVSRSFYSAISEALLADLPLPPLDYLTSRSSTSNRQAPKKPPRSGRRSQGSRTRRSSMSLDAQPYVPFPPQDERTPDESENLGDLVYSRVITLYPTNAAKITGMLMELEPGLLRNNDESFINKVQEANDMIVAMALSNEGVEGPKSQTDSTSTSTKDDPIFSEAQGECAPLFFQPGKKGFYSPQLGKPTKERLFVFRNVGRLIGLCLLQNELMPLPLCRHVIKFILYRNLSWHDYAFFDPEMYETMRKLIVDSRKENAAEVFKGLGLTYSIALKPQEGGGQVDLVPNGSEIEVTPQNVMDCVRRYCEYRMSTVVEKPLKALRRGVYEVIPRSALVGLNAEDFRLLLNGTMVIDAKQLQNFTSFNDESGEDNIERIHKFKRWIWALFDKMSQRELQDLVYFWTGSPGLPASEEGFQPMPSITIRPADDNYFPTANTCISRLYIPLYSSKLQLRTKVLQAIQIKLFGFV